MSILGLFWARFGSDVSLCLAIFPDRMLVMTGVSLTASGACRGDRRLCKSSVFITFRARFRPQNAEFWPNLTLFGSNSSQRWWAVCQPSQCSCRDYEETSASIFPPHISDEKAAEMRSVMIFTFLALDEQKKLLTRFYMPKSPRKRLEISECTGKNYAVTVMYHTPQWASSTPRVNESGDAGALSLLATR
jgi:hypothetical protein